MAVAQTLPATGHVAPGFCRAVPAARAALASGAVIVWLNGTHGAGKTTTVRLLTAPQTGSAVPLETFPTPTRWQTVNSGTLRDFSAVTVSVAVLDRADLTSEGSAPGWAVR